MRVSRGKGDFNMGGAQRLAQILNKVSGGTVGGGLGLDSSRH